MSNKYKFIDQEGHYFITMTVVGWIDVFTRDVYRDILLDSWRYCQLKKGLQIHAWVLMTNHAHMIVSRMSEQLLQDIMRDLKKFSSSRIIREIETNKRESRSNWMLNIFREAGRYNCNNKNYQFWIQDNHPFLLSNNFLYTQKFNYLHQNPVKAGFVLAPEEWKYSSAVDYYTNRKGLIEIVRV